jgi:hypothetical protein
VMLCFLSVDHVYPPYRSGKQVDGVEQQTLYGFRHLVSLLSGLGTAPAPSVNVTFEFVKQ